MAIPDRFHLSLLGVGEIEIAKERAGHSVSAAPPVLASFSGLPLLPIGILRLSDTNRDSYGKRHRSRESDYVNSVYFAHFTSLFISGLIDPFEDSIYKTPSTAKRFAIVFVQPLDPPTSLI
jgi:hypothetical protein